MFMTRVFLKRVPPPNIIHGILSAAFPGERSSGASECLWRIDNLRESRALIVVSEKKPDIRLIVEKVGADNRINPDNRESKTIDYDPFVKGVEKDQVWNFRLCLLSNIPRITVLTFFFQDG